MKFDPWQLGKSKMKKVVMKERARQGQLNGYGSPPEARAFLSSKRGEGEDEGEIYDNNVYMGRVHDVDQKQRVG